MILTLLHSTKMADAQSERGEDGKKFYQNVIKKIKKKFYSTPETNLPLPKTSQEFVFCEAYETSTDSKVFS